METTDWQAKRRWSIREMGKGPGYLKHRVPVGRELLPTKSGCLWGNLKLNSGHLTTQTTKDNTKQKQAPNWYLRHWLSGTHLSSLFLQKPGLQRHPVLQMAGWMAHSFVLPMSSQVSLEQPGIHISQYAFSPHRAGQKERPVNVRYNRQCVGERGKFINVLLM